MIESQSPVEVHVVIDISQSNFLPPKSMEHGHRIEEAARENEGVRIVVGANPVFRAVNVARLRFYQLAKRFIKLTQPGRVRMVATREETDRILAELCRQPDSAV